MVRFFDTITNLFQALAGMVVLLLTGLVLVDVLSRNLANAPLNGVQEMSQIAVLAILYLSLPRVLAEDRLTRSDGLLRILNARHPRTGALIDGLFLIAGASLIVLMIRYGIKAMIRSVERGYYIGNKGLFTFPEWIVQAMVVTGLTIFALQFLILATRRLLVAMNGTPQ